MNNPYLKRLRKQFIFVMMFIVIAFLTLIFCLQYFSTKRFYIEDSEEALDFALQDNRQREMKEDFFPGDKPQEGTGEKMRPPMDFGEEGQEMHMRIPVIVATVSADRQVSVTRNNMFYIEEDEDVTTLVLLANDSAEDTGTLEDYSFRYKKMAGQDGSVKIALMDISNEKSQLSALVKRSLVIISAVAVILFIISLFLSKLVLRPVAKAWEDQKRFVADASHELKTPLTVILSNTDMVIRSKDEQSPKNKRRLDNIRSESERMKELVNELLDIARGDVDDKKIIKEKTDLSELLLDELLTWEPVCFDAKRELDSDVDEGVTVMGDSTKLKKIFGILMDNAVKYSIENTKICVRLKKEQGKAHLYVEDVGYPISEEEKSSIFDRFYRADKSREETAGYGLGLSIAESLVREHEGKIWAESVPEEGDGSRNVNTFHVLISRQNDKSV